MMIAQTLLFLSSGVLGIFLGAQIAEAALLVPYWKGLKANNFFEFYQTYGKKIHQFFAPLTITATFLPLITAGYLFFASIGDTILLGLMGISTIAFFSTYFLFFKKTNQNFTNRSFSNQQLPLELEKWERWHWGRICFEFIAFGTSLLLLLNI